MHTITDCPRCKNDFMYHSTDTHLERTITEVDEVLTLVKVGKWER